MSQEIIFWNPSAYFPPPCLWRQYHKLYLYYICSGRPANRVWCMKIVEFPYKIGLITGADLNTLKHESFAYCKDNHPPNQYAISFSLLLLRKDSMYNCFLKHLFMNKESLPSVLNISTSTVISLYLCRKSAIINLTFSWIFSDSLDKAWDLSGGQLPYLDCVQLRAELLWQGSTLFYTLDYYYNSIHYIYRNTMMLVHARRPLFMLSYVPNSCLIQRSLHNSWLLNLIPRPSNTDTNPTKSISRLYSL